MAGCKNSTASGCRCVEHDLGLLAYAPNPTAYATALQHAQPIRLRVVTPGPRTPYSEPPCTNTPTCTCRTCQADRAQLIRRGPQGEGNASPFKTRRAA